MIGLRPAETTSFQLTPENRGVKTCEQFVTRIFDFWQIEQYEYALGLEFNVPDKFGNTRVAKVVSMEPFQGLKKWKVKFQFDQDLDNVDLVYHVCLDRILEGDVVIAPPKDSVSADLAAGLEPSI